MAAWTDLTQQQRDEVIQLISGIREWSGQIARLLTLGRALAGKWVGNVDGTINSLDAGDIPISSPDLGWEELSKQDILDLIGYAIQSSEYVQADGAPTTYNTNYHRGLYVRAAGIFGVLQQGQ